MILVLYLQLRTVLPCEGEEHSLPSSSSSSREASESSSSDGYLNVLRSLVVAMATFEKLREFVIFKIYIEKRTSMFDRTDLA